MEEVWDHAALFYRDTQKLTSCMEGKPKPMSPVKDNVMSSSPHTDIGLITSFWKRLRMFHTTLCGSDVFKHTMYVYDILINLYFLM